MTSRPLPTPNATDSSTIARFSLLVVWSTVATCHVSLLPTRVQTGAPLAVNACRLTSSSHRPLARRDAPHAASREWRSERLGGVADKCSPFGLDPGQPP